MAGLGEATDATYPISFPFFLFFFAVFLFPNLRDLIGKRHKQARGEEGCVKFHVWCSGGARGWVETYTQGSYLCS